MSKKITLNLNRVEGDLEIAVEVADGRVTDAWCVGTLYRGFEQIMVGRAPMDALAITPRICGICGTAHLYTAAMALEDAFGISVPANGTRIRNLCLLAEEIQSDCRQTFLMFTVDLARETYSHLPDFPATERAFTELQGTVYHSAISMSRKILEIVAILGGQWPHSSYMMPGGVTVVPSLSNLAKCKSITNDYQRWFERDIIGGPLEDWLALDSIEGFEDWVENKAPDSALALFNRMARAAGLDQVGFGSSLHLSYGSPPDPLTWNGVSANRNTLRAAGLFDGETLNAQPFDQSLISEDTSHAWFHQTHPGPLHPFDGETIPKHQPNSERYTWAKAPRYGGQVVQSGPLSQLLNANDPLIHALFTKDRGSSWLRQFARFQRQASSIKFLHETLDALLHPDNAKEPYINNVDLGENGEGFGLVEAARGSLGHWIKIRDGKIVHYQIVTPTAWNASPRDGEGQRGHWEESLIGLPLEDEDDPLMLGHVIRSHDPCLVCTVHVADTDRSYRWGDM